MLGELPGTACAMLGELPCMALGAVVDLGNVGRDGEPTAELRGVQRFDVQGLPYGQHDYVAGCTAANLAGSGDCPFGAPGWPPWIVDDDGQSYLDITSASVDGQPVGNLTRDEGLGNITLTQGCEAHQPVAVAG